MMITYNVYIQNILYNEICIKYDYQVTNSRRNANKIVALFSSKYLKLCCKNHLDFIILLARQSATPTKRHWTGVENIFRYLQGAQDLGLFYQFDQVKAIIGYTNAGYLSDPTRSDLKHVLYSYMVERIYH
jgi:hypothetical protein